MQRLNILGAISTFLYGTWRGWPLLLSVEKAFLAYVTLFGAQILLILALLYLLRPSAPGDAE